MMLVSRHVLHMPRCNSMPPAHCRHTHHAHPFHMFMRTKACKHTCVLPHRTQDWDTINIDWFTSKKDDKIPLPEFKLTFLWQEKNIAVAVDQVYSRVSGRARACVCVCVCEGGRGDACVQA